jgi:hypothetical protein
VLAFRLWAIFSVRQQPFLDAQSAFLSPSRRSG